jgi:hypothetical protein
MPTPTFISTLMTPAPTAPAFRSRRIECRRWLITTMLSRVNAPPTVIGSRHTRARSRKGLKGKYRHRCQLLSSISALAIWSWKGPQNEIADAILSAEWESAELGVGNEFTTGFMLEALHSLKACGAEWGEEGQQRVEREARRMNASPINRKRDRLRHF